MACADPDCPIRSAVTAPLVMDDLVVGTLTAWTTDPSPGLARATEEVAAWVSSQLALAELARTRTRVMAAELRALRAQISPHFIYNSLAAIASFVRTDPDRARELLIDFADFTRYALRSGGPVHHARRGAAQRRALPRARAGPVRRPPADHAAHRARGAAGDRALPRGAAPRRERRPPRAGRARRASATSRSPPATAGPTPRSASRTTASAPTRSGCAQILDGAHASDSIGLGNVDARLRQVYGDEFGLVVETAVGAGTKVSFRVPKFAPGIHAAP